MEKDIQPFKITLNSEGEMTADIPLIIPQSDIEHSQVIKNARVQRRRR